MMVALICIFSSGILGFASVLGGHLCLYLGYLLTLIGDRRDGRKFDWLRLALGFFIWVGLVIVGPAAMAAEAVATRSRL